MNDKNLHDQIWAGEHSGSHGALRRSKEKYRDLMLKGKVVDACCALASEYYTIATGEIIKIKRGNLGTFLHGLQCLWRAYTLAKRVKNEFGFAACTADQLDILQSVFRACRHSRLAEAAINEALKRKNLATHTHGLLCVGLARILFSRGDKGAAYNTTQIALGDAYQCQEENPRQASRIFKGCSVLHRKLGFNAAANGLLEVALELVNKSGADDQVAKIQAM